MVDNYIEDDDRVFLIVPSSKKIKVPNAHRILGTVGDHKSEKVTFKCPRVIEGRDITTCDRKYVGWNSPDGEPGSDRLVDIELIDEDYVLMRWEIRNSVASSSGIVSFSVHFEDVDEAGEVQYHWGTTICDDCEILDTINNILQLYDSIHVEGDTLVIEDYVPVESNTLTLRATEEEDEGFDSTKITKIKINGEMYEIETESIKKVNKSIKTLDNHTITEVQLDEDTGELIFCCKDGSTVKSGCTWVSDISDNPESPIPPTTAAVIDYLISIGLAGKEAIDVLKISDKVETIEETQEDHSKQIEGLEDSVSSMSDDLDLVEEYVDTLSTIIGEGSQRTEETLREIQEYIDSDTEAIEALDTRVGILEDLLIKERILKSTRYKTTVPSNVGRYALLNAVGGISNKNGETFKDVKVTEVLALSPDDGSIKSIIKIPQEIIDRPEYGIGVVRDSTIYSNYFDFNNKRFYPNRAKKEIRDGVTNGRYYTLHYSPSTPVYWVRAFYNESYGPIYVSIDNVILYHNMCSSGYPVKYIGENLLTTEDSNPKHPSISDIESTGIQVKYFEEFEGLSGYEATPEGTKIELDSKNCLSIMSKKFEIYCPSDLYYCKESNGNKYLRFAGEGREQQTIIQTSLEGLAYQDFVYSIDVKLDSDHPLPDETRLISIERTPLLYANQDGSVTIPSTGEVVARLSADKFTTVAVWIDVAHSRYSVYTSGVKVVTGYDDDTYVDYEDIDIDNAIEVVPGGSIVAVNDNNLGAYVEMSYIEPKV